MTRRDLFDLHQEILSDILNNRPFDEKFERKIREFILVAETKINTYVETVSALSYELKKFNDLANEVVSMRDLIKTERTKRNGESQSNHS